ncbi:unnamed protein product [Cylicocyclus nassatus]|uniref:CCHC-type domain-containing protein n=1 Tax=Cylicocyclus nassatus TaxID=53992 RepID=A0AA36GX04_CYLNA|nr:unnamed protein product [Cylicocyclus nassatus]
MIASTPETLASKLDEHRIAYKFRDSLENEITQLVEKTKSALAILKTKIGKEGMSGGQIREVLLKKGIESAENLEEFISTTERDSGLVTELCELLDTNVSQIKEKVQLLKAEVPGEGKGPNEEKKSTNQGKSKMAESKRENFALQGDLADLSNKRIGTLYEPRLNPHFQNWEENGREPEMAEQSLEVYGKGSFKQERGWKDRARDYTRVKEYQSRHQWGQATQAPSGSREENAMQPQEEAEDRYDGKEWRSKVSVRAMPERTETLNRSQVKATGNRYVMEKANEPRCYNCARYGHLARSCPEKHNSRQNSAITQNEESMTPITSLIHRVKAIGVRTQCKTAKGVVEALIDTGSMISIIPLKVLAAAYGGYDVDSLERIKEDDVNIVYDASSNEMKFLGGVRIPTAIQGGRTAQVAFYISEEDSLEILLGTNALESLGINIALQPERQKQGGHPQEQETVVRVGKRVIVPPYGVNGYWQIPLDEQTKHKSVFTTPEGLFQFKVTPFGLSTSPATFQRLMDTVLEGLLLR